MPHSKANMDICELFCGNLLTPARALLQGWLPAAGEQQAKFTMHGYSGVGRISLWCCVSLLMTNDSSQ